MNRLVTLVAVNLAVTLAVACKAKVEVGTAAPGKPGGEVVARIDDQVITVSEIEEKLARLDPFSRRRYSSPEQKKRFLENLVRFEVIAAEARSRGYDRDPDVQRVLKKQLIDTMIQREVDDRLKVEAIADEEVEKYYTEHPEHFRRPEQVRVSQIFTADEGQAKKAAAEARVARTDKQFRALVERYSEDEDSKIRGGDLTFFDRESADFPKPLVEAAFALADDAVSAPVQSDKGWHVLKMTQRRPGFTRPLGEVKNEIRRRILSDVRAKKIEELVAEMRKKVKVEIYEEQLAKVTVEGKRP